MYEKKLVALCKGAVACNKTDVNMTAEFQIDFLKFCILHKLENVVYYAIQQLQGTFSDKQTELLFKDKYNQAILNDASQQYYLDMITSAFADNNIDYLVMKGMVIKKLYPSADLRQCADIDIYIGPDNAEKARVLMEELGFKCESFGDLAPTDNYKIDKFSYIELHRTLIPSEYKWSTECRKITDRLICKGNHEYVMSDEDFYIFMICHIAKHMRFGGIGIRAVLDVWIYMRNYTNLDWDFIDSIMEKCELSGFHKCLKRLVGYWFEDKEADDVTLKLADYVSTSGWNGNMDQRTSSQINNIAGTTSSKTYARLKWYFKALFMDKRVMEAQYPALKKHSFLLPFCWLHRAGRALIKKQDAVKNVLTAYSDVDMSKAQQINKFRKEIGL